MLTYLTAASAILQVAHGFGYKINEAPTSRNLHNEISKLKEMMSVAPKSLRSVKPEITITVANDIPDWVQVCECILCIY